MSIWDYIYFWKKEKEEDEIVIPYKPGYVPSDTIVYPTEPPKTMNVQPQNIWSNLKPIDIAKIETYPFPDNQFFHDIYPKTQIVLHHTVSGNGVEGDISSWEGDPVQVAVCIVVDRDGIAWQLFSSKYWAYHLGVSTNNHALNKASIAIEIDNWGWLIPGDNTTKQFGLKPNGQPNMIYTVLGKYYTYYGNSVTVPMEYYADGFRGYRNYEKYTEKQLRTVGELLLLWRLKYNISLKYNEDMWDISPRALNGEPGVWTHVSYRPASAKTDCHPQPSLIDMLKTLDGIS